MTIVPKKNISLAPYTTWKIGGPAAWLVEAKRPADYAEALAFAQAQRLPLRVLGNGSNTLVADHGFPGVVVLARNDQMEWEGQCVEVGAGAKLGQLISGALQHNLGGLEWLIGVPGCVGGSIYGNAGQGSGRTDHLGLGDYVVWVEGLDQAGQLRRWTKAECQFGYRESYFKHHPTLIIQARLELPSVNPKLERQKLADWSAKKRINQPLQSASAGCMFKNPKVDSDTLPDELREYIFPDHTISSWRLIKQVDLQGKQLGQLQISPVHANFLVNLGGGTADQAVQLISLVKQQVRDKLGVQLQEEIQYLGFEHT